MDTARKRIRVLLINTYDMNDVRLKYEAGTLPSHHLYGALELEKAYEIDVVIPKHVQFPILNRIGSWFDIPFLDQEIRALTMLRKFDIIYAPYAASNTKLLVLLKCLRVLRKPIIILVHFELFGKPNSNWLKRFVAKKLIVSYDFILFLSTRMKAALNANYAIDVEHMRRRFALSNWGVDATFYERYRTKQSPEERRLIVTAGNSSRDFDLVVRLAKRIDFQFKIYCKPESYPSSYSELSKNVQVLSGSFPFDEICKDHDNARIVLIPLKSDFEGTAGLTSLLDALAVGRPVIMTNNRNIDIDFQVENIGVSLETNDEDMWVDAIASLLNNFDKLREMEVNALRLANQRFNIKHLAGDLAHSILTVHNRSNGK
jgi:glycosyltransferase involved in cell wall biosynthesis